jgi:uroporphyrinogen decarboxylase
VADAARQRVLQAAARTRPDRIPVDYWADGEVTGRLVRRLGVADKEALLQRLGVDLRYVSGPVAPARERDGLFEDHWGVLRRPVTVEGVDRTGRAWSWSYQHVHTAPLERATSVAEIERHPWPSAEAWDYSGVRAECERARATGCAVVCGGDRLDRTAQLKPATYLRGIEQFLSDLVLEPALAECILEHIAAYYLDYNERVFHAASCVPNEPRDQPGAAPRAPEGARSGRDDQPIDIFFMGDDLGTQTSLWVSPRMYRRFFKERFRRFCDLAHRHGLKTMYHTCGNVLALVPELIDCGLDILQSLQPAAMDLAALKREYGRALAFQGGIDIQQTMPHGTPDDVRREVADRAALLGEGGGYIFCTAHNLLPDVPTENLEALFDAYREQGVS